MRHRCVRSLDRIFIVALFCAGFAFPALAVSVSGSAVFYASEMADGTIFVGFYPAISEAGTSQAIYMFATHDGIVWVRQRSGWVPWTGTDMYSAPSIDGDLTNPTVPRQLSTFRETFCTSCAAVFSDLHLWVGYGADVRDMMGKGNYKEVLISTTSPFHPDASDLIDPPDHYKSQGGLLEVKLKAVAGDQYTITDVNSDIDPYESREHEIDVHFEAADYSDDHAASNAKLKIRGKSTREADLKSYSVKLNSGVQLWRNERTLQLNKHPYDLTRVRNKLAFDLFAEIPYVNSLRTQFVHVMFDDDGNPATPDVDYGLFTHVEKMGKDYLSNRGWPASSNLYKAQNFVFLYDSRLAVKSDGSPQSKSDFERVLSIENGRDHHVLLEMVEDINNENTDFNTIFTKYFNRNNYLSWLAANILLGNRDTVNQNFGLLQLPGSSRFYFLPWDYDGSLGFESQPDVASAETFYADWQLGLSNWWDSPLHRRFLLQPGNLAALTAAVEQIRVRYLSADKIKAKIDSYKPVIQEVVTRDPDLSKLETVSDDPAIQWLEWEAEYARLVSVIDDNYRGFRQRLENPMPFWQSAGVEDGKLVLRWDPSIDLQNDAVSYLLQVADRPDFSENSIRLRQDRLTGTSWTTDPFPHGTYYMKVVAKDSKGHSQGAFDRFVDGEKTYVGVHEFTQ